MLLLFQPEARCRTHRSSRLYQFLLFDTVGCFSLLKNHHMVYPRNRFCEHNYGPLHSNAEISWYCKWCKGQSFFFRSLHWPLFDRKYALVILQACCWRFSLWLLLDSLHIGDIKQSIQRVWMRRIHKEQLLLPVNFWSSVPDLLRHSALRLCF